MRFSVIIFACLLTVFAAAEDATLPPGESLESGNDQDVLGEFLDSEQETEAAEEVTTVIDELPPPEDEDFVPEDEQTPEDEGDLPTDTQVDETPSGTDEGGDVDVVGEVEAPESGEELDTPDEEETRPPKRVDDNEDAIGGAEDPEIPETPETSETPETIGENEEPEPEIPSDFGSFEEPEENVEEPEDLGQDVEDFPIDHSGFDQTTDAPTPLPQPRFTPFPTYKPSLRPVSPYFSTDDDPLKGDNDEAFDNWGFNQDTLDELEKDAEELAQDNRVIIALSTVFGIMFFFSVFVAYQMLENPNGICASLCRISVAFWCGITRCICYPCRAMCGCTGSSQSNRQDHMMLPNDGHFTHDLELS